MLKAVGSIPSTGTKIITQGWGCSSVVVHVLKALSFIPSIKTKTKHQKTQKSQESIASKDNADRIVVNDWKRTKKRQKR
jgi:hypothetical protein